MYWEFPFNIQRGIDVRKVCAADIADFILNTKAAMSLRSGWATSAVIWSLVAQLRLSKLRNEIGAEGIAIRRLLDLTLLCSESPTLR
jgi:hypothetical protein